MPDDKTTKVPETAAPDTGPGQAPRNRLPSRNLRKPKPPHAGTEAPGAGRRQSRTARRIRRPPTSEKAGAEKSPNVSVYNFFGNHGREESGGKRKKRRRKQPPPPDKGKEPEKLDKAVKKEPDKTAESPKRRGRPPKETQAKTPADKKKTAPAKEPRRSEENFHLEGGFGQGHREQGKGPEGSCPEKGGGTRVLPL